MPEIGTLLDFSVGFPAAQSIRDAGHAGVVGYVSDRRRSAQWAMAKPLTRAYCESLQAAGLLVASCYQYGKTDDPMGELSDWRGGYDAGVRHATRAYQLHIEAGGPRERPIYGPVDDNPSRWEFDNLVLPFATGWRDVAGPGLGAMYCNDKLITWFLELGEENPVSWFWQHEWDGVPGVNPDHPAAHLHQVEADKRQVGGVGVDVNRILKDDFGQWSQSGGGPVMATQFLARLTQLTAADDGLREQPVQVLVTHTNEPGPYKPPPSHPSDTQGMLNFCANVGNGASYHTITDREGVTGRCNDDEYAPWAAGWTANRKGLHNCLTGWSAQSREEWLSHSEQMAAAADIDAFNCKRHDIPPVKVTGADIRAGRKGLCGHIDTSIGWGETDHHDPGDFYPWDVHVRLVQEKLGAPPAPIPPMRGAIKDHYLNTAGLVDILGAPAPDHEFTTPDGLGRYTHFANGGSIYWTPTTGAFAVHGGIRNAWQEHGWEKGPLGYPVSDEFEVPWGRQSNFQHGFITWTDHRAHIFC